ncbi:hypothetical protein SD80_026195 [Scytonema tolypothrichoides VB-61278]|nr:hypothetical protein SD80_026195 [Scytonema tolypothrichoides VB-61278]
MDAQEFLLNYCKGQRTFFRVKLQNANFQGANLRGINIWGANLKGANLQGANFEGSDLSGVNFEGSDLSGANFEGANLKYSKLIKANFANANLAHTNFDLAWLLEANFSQANLTGASLKTPFMGGANFSQANLNRANLEDACKHWKSPDNPYWDDELFDLVTSSINFSGASLKEADLKRGYFVNSDFSEANLSLANLREAELGFTNFRGACLDEADFAGANLDRCDFRKASLINSNFTGANLSQANLSDLIVGIVVEVDHSRDYYSRACFIRANLYKANLKSSDFSGTNFVGANFSGCDLSNAILADADLSESNISGACFENAEFSIHGCPPCHFYKSFFYERYEPIGLDLKDIKLIKSAFKHIPTPQKLEIIIGRSESRKIFMEALDQTKKRLILVNPWLTQSAINKEVLQKFRYLLKRGCHINIGWGNLNDIGSKKLIPLNRKILISKMNQQGQDWKYGVLPELEKLEKEYPNQFQLKLLGTHEKFLVCDSSFAMIGSHNFLTSGDASDER